MLNVDNLKTAIYCRVANEDDSAIATQEDRLRIYAQENGYGNVTIYSDNGASGLDFNRPALSKLEADIQAGWIDALIVRDISRIGRNCFETENWIADLRKKGVKLLTVDGVYDENPISQCSKAFFQAYCKKYEKV